jgi:Zn-dependent peptidase ImmA (M78 family)
MRADIRRKRLRQIFKWLQYEFPHDGVVRMRVVAKMPKSMSGCFGVCAWNEKNEAMLWIGPTSKSMAITTLLHEYAHVLTDGRGSGEGHGNEFYQVLGQIERAYFYGGGIKDSKEY